MVHRRLGTGDLVNMGLVDDHACAELARESGESSQRVRNLDCQTNTANSCTTPARLTRHYSTGDEMSADLWLAFR